MNSKEWSLRKLLNNKQKLIENKNNVSRLQGEIEENQFTLFIGLVEAHQMVGKLIIKI